MLSDPDAFVIDEILDIKCFYDKLDEPIDYIEIGTKAFDELRLKLAPPVRRHFSRHKTLFGLKIKKSRKSSWSIRAVKKDVAIVD